MWSQPRSHARIVKQIGSSEAVDAPRTQHTRNFPEVSFGIFHMFEYPVGNTCIERAAQKGQIQSIENLRLCTESISQHVGININPGDLPDIKECFCCRVTWTSTNFENL